MAKEENHPGGCRDRGTADTRPKVELENGQEILAYISGRMRKFYILFSRETR